MSSDIVLIADNGVVVQMFYLRMHSYNSSQHDINCDRRFAELIPRMLITWRVFLLLLHGTASKVLHVVWMVPEYYPEYNISASIGTLAMALKRIQTDQLLPDYDHFNITWLDTPCDSQKSIGLLTDHLIKYHTTDVIIGPPCTEAMVPVADLAAYYNVPIFSWVTRQYVLDDKTKYSTLVRSRPPISSLVEMFYAISIRFKWKRAAMVYTDDQRSTRTLAQSIIRKFDTYRQFNLVEEFAMSLNSSHEELRQMMNSIKGMARIIFLIIPHAELRQYMLAFHDQGMTDGDYQFLFTELAVTSVRVYRSELVWKRNDGHDDAARQAFENILIFTFAHVLGNNPNWEAANESYEEIFSGSSLPRPVQPDGHSAFLYDAVVLFAMALNETIAANNNATGTEIFRACVYKLFDVGSLMRNAELY
ncbi:atrial natriuretic peptide receptor 3-like [Gigantopelta aegis]|uniref:atrial natriuretic peptide receptor 3-like n=1 Tax=Gigantopelta aegis TaxID=1735272 RepID=UPI001B88A8FE|nr:atrial natriuretic peptide receptor 3-like [Gigantopelta aegis]